MKTRIFRSTFAAMIAVAGLVMCHSAHASTFSVTRASTNTNTTFTITRSGAGIDSAETVIYRTVSLSAYANQHFVAISNSFTFAAGETSKQVVVAYKSPNSIDVVSRYQTSNSRAFRLEVIDAGGFKLASGDSEIVFGSAFKLQTNCVVQSAADIDLVYFNGTSYASGINSSKYVDVPYTPPSSDVQSSGTYQGYVLIDDSYDYSKKAATVSTAPLFNRLGGSGQYYDAIGNKMYVTVCFTEKEKDDGYAYVQIVGGNGSAPYDTGADPDGAVNEPVNSLYKACFELKKGSGVYSGEGKQFFPHRYDYTDRSSGGQSASHTEFFLEDSYLWQQDFCS